METKLKCTKPKRPLSAYNLFYRFKHQKVLQFVSVGAIRNKSDVRALIKVPPGLENYQGAAPTSKVHSLRRQIIVKDMECNLLPKDSKDRSHRRGKLNSVISFVQLGRLMNAGWQNCDDFGKVVFEELADIGRKYYDARLSEYHAQANGLGVPPKFVRKPADIEMPAAMSLKPPTKRSITIDDVLSRPTTSNATCIVQPTPQVQLFEPSRHSPCLAGDMPPTFRFGTALRPCQDITLSPLPPADDITVPSQPSRSPSNVEQLLISRVQELEGQLLEARIRELKAEISQHKRFMSRVRSISLHERQV